MVELVKLAIISEQGEIRRSQHVIYPLHEESSQSNRQGVKNTQVTSNAWNMP